MKKLLFVPIIILGLFLSGHAFAIANPASVKCIADGGILQNLNGGSVESTKCLFSDGSSCDEWAYYRGECTHGANINTCANDWAYHKGICSETSNLYPNDPIACTMEYAPVCGSKPVQCVKAPCNPVEKTYSNMCMMNADNATLVRTGECNNSGKTQPAFCSGNKFTKMNRGSRGDMVRALQEFLFGQGYTIGTIDGSFGLKTRKAVIEFQKAKGLTADGIFGNNSKFAVCNIK